MAEDLELDKNSPEDEVEEKIEKKAKSDDKKNSKKADKKKKNKKGIVKFFKDAKAEFKKVVWPGPKETTRNTIVVVVVCLLAGAVVFGVDSLFGLLNNLLFR
ncbi:MAG: preprotein translocase subunit SecE [Oscillospiraceae bacterium]|nr:preprotein translocase subunit SecE [Oscillospiraceae bacterium]